MAIPQSQPKFLKMETPQTTDGKTLAYDENRQVIYKTSFLPLTAKTEILRNTSKLPEYLRPILTEMNGDTKEQPKEVKETSVEPVVQQTPIPAPALKKGGRPRKVKTD